MSIRTRPMRSEDVPQCVAIVAACPVLVERYGDALRHLGAAWTLLLGREAFGAVVFEESRDGVPRICGVGTSAFVTDNFVRQAKTPPFFWIGPRLATSVISGDDSPFLSNSAVRRANSAAGLNLAGWHGCARPEDGKRPELLNTMFCTFVANHRGFRLKEVISQAESREMLEALHHVGAWFLQEAGGEYTATLPESKDMFLQEPHIVGLTRNLAHSRSGFWVSSLFSHESPLIGLTPSQQRLLKAALEGMTDQELAESLGISLSAVKKQWQGIYDRVALALPQLLPSEGRLALTDLRGREKKKRVLAYIAQHPEELRPIDPALLGRNGNVAIR